MIRTHAAIAWEKQRREATQRTKEPVTFLFFNEDAVVYSEITETRTVYRYAGRIEINRGRSRGRAYQAGPRVIAYGGQILPARKSAADAIINIATEAQNAADM